MKKTVISLFAAVLLISAITLAWSEQDRKQKDLLVIVEKSFVIEQTPPEDPALAASGAVRVYAEVTNGRTAKATGITATCTFKNDNDTSYDARTETVGTLAPGEKKEVLFYFPSKGYAEDYRSKKRVLTVKADEK